MEGFPFKQSLSHVCHHREGTPHTNVWHVQFNELCSDTGPNRNGFWMGNTPVLCIRGEKYSNATCRGTRIVATCRVEFSHLWREGIQGYVLLEGSISRQVILIWSIPRLCEQGCRQFAAWLVALLCAFVHHTVCGDDVGTSNSFGSINLRSEACLGLFQTSNSLQLTRKNKLQKITETQLSQETFNPRVAFHHHCVFVCGNNFGTIYTCKLHNFFVFGMRHTFGLCNFWQDIAIVANNNSLPYMPRKCTLTTPTLPVFHTVKIKVIACS